MGFFQTVYDSRHHRSGCLEHWLRNQRYSGSPSTTKHVHQERWTQAPWSSARDDVRRRVVEDNKM
jgi:hypothetical protein